MLAAQKKCPELFTEKPYLKRKLKKDHDKYTNTG